ncbi:RNA polymerase-associated factor [Entophlyctis luteolus]|nr:RNA polymerase-associated factor [Entophlyctis luteolus]
MAPAPQTHARPRPGDKPSHPPSHSGASAAGRGGAGAGGGKKLGHDFPCPLLFTNTLPHPPFEPKLLSYDSTARRAQLAGEVVYLPTCPLEVHCDAVSSAQHPQLLALALNATTDSKSAPATPKPVLDPKDIALLAPYAPPAPKPVTAAAAALSAAASRPIASWLRRTEYIANDTNVAPSGAASASRRQALSSTATTTSQSRKLDVSSALSIPAPPRDANALIARIDDTFEAAARSFVANIKHPTNPSLTATELLPVFPDYERWPHAYFSLVFDADPVAKGVDATGASLGADDDDDGYDDPEQYSRRGKILREKALLKFMESSTNAVNDTDAGDTDQERILALYAPNREATDVIIAKVENDDDDEDDDDDDDEDTRRQIARVYEDSRTNPVLEYRHVKDYTYKEKKFDVDNPMVFLSISDEVATYHKLSGRFDLSRKRAQFVQPRNSRDFDPFAAKPTTFHTRRRPRDPQELYAKRKAMHEILPLDVPAPNPVQSSSSASQVAATEAQISVEEMDIDNEISAALGGADSGSESDGSGDSRTMPPAASNAVPAAALVDEDGDAEW